jgi:phosphatidylinositol glycan class C protein
VVVGGAFVAISDTQDADPDNYTDPATFLENLQRNPRLQPYDFWPLVADSTVIVQHVCSVIVFVVCFVGIFQERISPNSVVGWSSAATFLGWLLWERWVTEDEARFEEELMVEATAAMSAARSESLAASGGEAASGSAADAAASAGAGTANSTIPPATAANAAVANVLARSGSSRRTGSIRRRRPTLRGDGVAPGAAAILAAAAAAAAAATAGSSRLGSQDDGSQTAAAAAQTDDAPADSQGHTLTTDTDTTGLPQNQARHLAPISTSGAGSVPLPPMSPYPRAPVGRSHKRLGTIKSAILIYFTLLSMSPILKSLTRSTSSDSIWAMSFWLLLINVFSFDYSPEDMSSPGGSSLSTNAALMASTVLASRLPSTVHVFGLTLFSLQVFGLLPVFRRYVRDRSFRYHVLLTAALVLAAGAGVGIIMSEPRGGGSAEGPWPWKGALAGSIVATCIAVMAMGGCSWWLISLQKYKNEIRGPWDPARPIIMSRRRWNHR